MNSITSFFQSEFPALKEQWEASLKNELKITELGSKGLKKLPSGTLWPTLSLDAPIKTHLSAQQSWKKASITYAYMPEDKAATWMKEDLKAGVRNLFFHIDALDHKVLKLAFDAIKDSPEASETEIFLLTDKPNILKDLPTVDYRYPISGKQAHDLGADAVLELALMSLNLIRSESHNHPSLGVYVDSQFFGNIAKIRAAKLLGHRIYELNGMKSTFSTVALTSYTEWTLYERYSNILRNQTAVASSYIAGADHVQSSGYNILFDLETYAQTGDEHTDRSRRMARNTSHVLALESMLGTVTDAAFGSYHVENLTQHLCTEAWKKMQLMVGMSEQELSCFIETESRIIQEKRQEMVRTRKHVQAGLNDYADAKETLKVKLNSRPKVSRIAQDFEHLRFKVEQFEKKPEVFISLFGDYSHLSARLNFIKNYFEVLGLRVLDPGHSVTHIKDFENNSKQNSERILVVCAADEDYDQLLPVMGEFKNRQKFIAGKAQAPAFYNLFAGQDIYAVLSKLISSWGQP